MSRPKRIRETTGKEYRSDRELVSIYQTNMDRLLKARKPHMKLKYDAICNAAANELWEKYFKLRMKMKFQLIKVCRRNNLIMPEIIEEYDSESWIKFIEQMDGIRLHDVAHIPNWSVYIRLWGYWRSMNRDILKKWFDWKKFTTPIIPVSKDSEQNEGLSNMDVEIAKRYSQLDDEVQLSINQEIFRDSLDQLTESITTKQKRLLIMKMHGAKNREIMTKLKMDNKTYKENINILKIALKSIIEQIASKKGLKLSYDDLLTSFGG